MSHKIGYANISFGNEYNYVPASDFLLLNSSYIAVWLELEFSIYLYCADPRIIFLGKNTDLQKKKTQLKLFKNFFSGYVSICKL